MGREAEGARGGAACFLNSCDEESEELETFGLTFYEEPHDSDGSLEIGGCTRPLPRSFRLWAMVMYK